jgi:hypothetical protein
MWNLLWLINTIYFVTITLAVYHLQQQELDRIQLQMDENSRILDKMQRYLHIDSADSSFHRSLLPSLQKPDRLLGMRKAQEAKAASNRDKNG